MSKVDDGGPAFPIWQPDMNLGDTAGPGMSLRDYFAAAALTGLICSATKEMAPYLYGHAAYLVADAMLKARATQQDEER